MLICIDDRYDPTGEVPYANVEEFLRMCDDCFGERPALREAPDGSWRDSRGIVLMPKDTRDQLSAHEIRRDRLSALRALISECEERDDWTCNTSMNECLTEVRALLAELTAEAS